MRSRPPRRGLSRVDVLVLIISTLILTMLLMPMLRTSNRHDGSKRCRNNVRCIVLALQTYHEFYRVFPMGVTHSGPASDSKPPIDAALGPSWWFAVLPYLEQRTIHDKILDTQRAGGPENHRFCADDMNAAGIPLSTLSIEYMRCLSSPMPAFETQAGPILLPTYVGIAGGCDIDPDSPDFPPDVELRDSLGHPRMRRMSPQLHQIPPYHNRFKGTSALPGGIVTSSGMLPPCQHVSLSGCQDGTSNIMMVAEQSDWLRDQDPGVDTTYHGDPGWTVGGTGPGGGWLSGTTRGDPVPRVETLGGPPAIWGADCWNVTTVRYALGHKRVMGDTPLPGCSENHGINNPLQSPHPGYVVVGMVDGSVQRISTTTDLAVLLRLAIRDDGQPVKLD